MKKIRLLCRMFCWAGGTALLIGCSGKYSTPGAQTAHGDSTSIADSSSLAGSVPAARVLSYEQRRGKHLYAKYCAVCHGDEGKGDGFNAFNLDPKPRDFSDARYMNALTDDRVLMTISEGGRSVNRSSLMPSWGGRMNKEEIAFVLAYIRLFAKPG